MAPNNLAGKSVVITGASAGLGKYCAAVLAEKGAHVTLACRSRPKADAVVAEIRAKSPAAAVDVMEVDLADLRSVKRFADEYKLSGRGIDVLMNNAGASPTSTLTLTKDGIEMQMGGNHLGHFLLTTELLPVIEETARKNGSARIVNLSSKLHNSSYPAGIDFDNINNPKTYGPLSAYGQSKLANILFTKELQKRLSARGFDNIYVNACHPGGVATDIYDTMPYVGRLSFLIKMVLTGVAHGALTQLYLAASPDVETVGGGQRGLYFEPTARLTTPSAAAQDPALAERLWKWSAEVVKDKIGVDVASA
ncbi:hypothetical protein DFJ73DRAFT_777589 [Zopfochytrium polystomum]|nr:hypothetical protein DFJ73DRAFT_777589 [Zopfochytrium polystomum]